jgi:hypothetical protein
MAGHTILVKSVLTNIVIYYITVLNILVDILAKIDRILKGFPLGGL